MNHSQLEVFVVRAVPVAVVYAKSVPVQIMPPDRPGYDKTAILTDVPIHHSFVYIVVYLPHRQVVVEVGTQLHANVPPAV